MPGSWPWPGRPPFQEVAMAAALHVADAAMPHVVFAILVMPVVQALQQMPVLKDGRPVRASAIGGPEYPPGLVGAQHLAPLFGVGYVTDTGEIVEYELKRVLGRGNRGFFLVGESRELDVHRLARPGGRLLRVPATPGKAPPMVEGACARRRATDKRGRAPLPTAHLAWWFAWMLSYSHLLARRMNNSFQWFTPLRITAACRSLVGRELP